MTVAMPKASGTPTTSMATSTQRPSVSASTCSFQFGSAPAMPFVPNSARPRSSFRFGLGALAWEPLGQRLLVERVCDYHGNLANGAVPLLVFDVWEHAYHLQYRNVRVDFVNALWNVVNWADVAARFARARQSSLG